MKRISPNLGRCLVLGVLVVAALAGCREEEQGRVLLYDKGHYLGKKDQPLSAETLSELRQRGLKQNPEL